MVDALSCKVGMARLRIHEIQPVQELEMHEGKIYVSHLRMVPDLRQEIGSAQEESNDFHEFKKKMLSKDGTDFREGDVGMLYFQERIVYRMLNC
jgi:hypothetical protein